MSCINLIWFSLQTDALREYGKKHLVVTAISWDRAVNLEHFSCLAQVK